MKFDLHRVYGLLSVVETTLKFPNLGAIHTAAMQELQDINAEIVAEAKKSQAGPAPKTPITAEDGLRTASEPQTNRRV